MNFKGFYFFGVFDGHGFYGHLVSDFIKKNLINEIEACLN